MEIFSFLDTAEEMRRYLGGYKAINQPFIWWYYFLDNYCGRSYYFKGLFFLLFCLLHLYLNKQQPLGTFLNFGSLLFKVFVCFSSQQWGKAVPISHLDLKPFGFITKLILFRSWHKSVLSTAFFFFFFNRVWLLPGELSEVTSVLLLTD